MIFIRDINAAALSAGLCVLVKDIDFRYVGVFSVDRLHSSEVEKNVARQFNPTITELLGTGYGYGNALTSAPSNSFPGTLNQSTGVRPKTPVTGVWSDVERDRRGKEK